MFVVGSCVHFRSFGVHSSMNAENAIEKLWKIGWEKEVKRNEHI